MSYKSILCTTALSVGLGVSAASAAVLVSIEESGSDVVATMSGTYDVSALTFVGNDLVGIGVYPELSIINFGPDSANNLDFFFGLTSAPANFGSGGANRADSFSVGTDAFSLSFDPTAGAHLVGVAPGTTSGTVSGSMTFENASFSTLGLTEGIFDWAWESDTARVVIGDDTIAPVPLPAGVTLLGLALAGLGAAARRKRT